jgi:hypothetical protein
MMKTEALKDLYEALGGNRAEVAGISSEIGIYNAILALGEVDAKKFIPDAIAAIAENFSAIVPSEVNLEKLTVRPTAGDPEYPTIIIPSGDTDGWDKVLAVPVDASIDENIVAGNIKNGVTILGVTGSYTGE